jgi:hypothetical protein
MILSEHFDARETAVSDESLSQGPSWNLEHLEIVRQGKDHQPGERQDDTLPPAHTAARNGRRAVRADSARGAL